MSAALSRPRLDTLILEKPSSDPVSQSEKLLWPRTVVRGRFTLNTITENIMKNICRFLLIVVCLLLALISYDALANVHYDVDPTSMLASLLGLSIPILGMASGLLSIVLLISFAITFGPRKRTLRAKAGQRIVSMIASAVAALLMTILTMPQSAAAQVDPEPSDDPTGLQGISISATEIGVTWTDATGTVPPAGYLVYCDNGVGHTPPTDGVPVTDDADCADNAGVQTISQGIGNATWGGLSSVTGRWVRIYPYTNSGAEIDYKTDNPATVFAYTLPPEPSAHPTNFTATADSSSEITVSWTDATPFANYYLVTCALASTSSTPPADGPRIGDDPTECGNGGMGLVNRDAGVESYTWIGLESGTAYNFTIYPYAWQNGVANYKTDNNPATSATTDGCPPFPMAAGTTTELNQAIGCYNAAPAGDYAISITQDITLITATVPITNPVATSLQINGNGQTIDGADAHRIFTILDGDVTVDNLTMQHGRDTNNTCHGTTNCGGAIYIGDNPVVTVMASLLQNNGVGDSGFDGEGGAISSSGSLTVRDSMFISNTAGTGGAIWVSSHSPTISGSTFYDNRASSGGALLIGFNIGGLIVNSTFSGNSATNSGGAIYLPTVTAPVEIRYSTLVNNSAASGGAISLSTSNLALASSIIAHNVGGDCVNTSGTLAVDIDSFDSDGSCGGATQSSNLNFGPLQDNGGPPTSSGEAPWTHALLVGNDAIDAGDDTACADASVNNLDQRGTVRPLGAKCDSGAYEYNACAITPWQAGNSAELNEAIGCYNAAIAGSYTISVTQGITLTMATPIITNTTSATLKINGNGQTIDGDNSYRHFTIHAGQVTIDNVTLQNGNYAGSQTCSSSGGACSSAIDLRATSTLTLTAATIVSNTSRAENGAGIAVVEATLYVYDSYVAGNQTGTNGGGLFNASGAVTLVNTTFTNNRADLGGAIYNTGGAVTLFGNTLYNNSANHDGGGIYSEAGMTRLFNSTISGNTAETGGVSILGEVPLRRPIAQLQRTALLRATAAAFWQLPIITV